MRYILFVFCFFTTINLLGQSTDTLKHVDSLRKTPAKIEDTVLPDVSSYISKGEKANTIDEEALRKARKNDPQTGYVINGKVVDNNSGEGIPFATIFFKKSAIGTAADLEGNFVLKFDKLPSDTLRIEAMGYTGISKILRKTQHDYNFILELDRSNTPLSEVVFYAGEDPAITLMKRIIEKKPLNNPDRLENYKYEAYNRLEADLQRMTKEQFAKIPILKSYTFIFNNLDTQSESKPYLPLYLTETMSDYYYQRKPNKQREIIKASLVKGVNNENVDKYLGTLYQNINVYDNYIPVFDKKFVSPISNDGLFFYKYKIKDTQMAYGHRIILVQYKPKREGENCFAGDFWVVDSVLAIQRVSMDLPKLANINWVEKASLYQEYAPVDSIWFCIKDKFVATFGAYKSKKLPGMIGRKTTTYHHIAINDTGVTRMLNDPKLKEEVVKSDSARLHNDEWWAASRPDTLSKNEKAIYKMVDTINQMPITQAYINTITFLTSGVKDFGPIELGPYYYLYSRNPVEGNRFRLSVGTPRTLKNAHFTGYLAYGTKDEEFKYGLTGLWILNRAPRLNIYASYVHDINPRTNNQERQSNDNIFSNMFRKRGVPWKLAMEENEHFEVYKEYFGGFSHKIIFDHIDFRPFAPLPSYDIFKDIEGNPASNVISTEVGLELRYAYKEKYLEGLYKRKNLSSKYPILRLQLTSGIKGALNSAYKYQKAVFTINESINIPPLGHINYSLYAGKYFGTLPYPLLKLHPGNEFYSYNKNTFEMMNTYEFISDQFAGFSIEHNIGGGIFNKIPGIKQLKLRQFWTAKGVIGSLSNDNNKLNIQPGKYPFRHLEGNPYLEIGTGVSNILELFRIDFVWRVTPAPAQNEAKSRYFGIFGGISFDF